MAKQPTALIILDGFANRESEHGNAVKLANKPNFDRYFDQYPTTQIEASGLDVGLQKAKWQFRSWSYEYWCWTYCLSKLNSY